jgi:hypothetical protein
LSKTPPVPLPVKVSDKWAMNKIYDDHTKWTQFLFVANSRSVLIDSGVGKDQHDSSCNGVFQSAGGRDIEDATFSHKLSAADVNQICRALQGIAGRGVRIWQRRTQKLINHV